ncbi:hypothetical protein [Microvirga aerophila]|uniref:Uncharacterized protein n=1 Tax=Microvirga aerophila TaxID=670291 RepID=A0A512C2W7_9HYPH|nr:hypothetical protein [Microvirga aerophila]GEO18556.1 hypothetical protein MAE02_62520 [Microvirga aerophila]
METIRLIVEKITLGEETAARVWSPDCSGLGIIAKSHEEAVTLANRAVADLRKSRGQDRPYETVVLRSTSDLSRRRRPGPQPLHR